MTHADPQPNEDAEVGHRIRRRRAARQQRPPIPEIGIGWELFILALTLLSLVNALLIVFTTFEPIAQVVLIVEGSVGVIFLLDFLVRLARSGNRRAYFFRGLGWADLLSAAPLMRWLRLLRLPELRRRAKAAGGIMDNAELLMHTRAVTTLLVVLLLTILVLEFGSSATLWVERNAPNANIKTASDALWYVIVSIATVGYGDKYPVTNEGRLVGTVILVTGIALFSTLTGFVAHFFFGREPSPGQSLRERRLERLQAEMVDDEEERVAAKDDPRAIAEG